jgi:spore maturation protein SpmB
MGLRGALAATLAAAAIPYGYTIAVWSSGAVLMHTHGTPTVADVFAFVGGGLIGYVVAWLLARGVAPAAATLGDPGDRALAGALNWLATGAAVGAAALVAELNGWEAWPLAAAAATAIYLLGASVQLVVVTRAARLPSPRRPGRTTRSPARRP